MLAKCRPDQGTAAIMEAVEDFARRGLRTLVFAHKTLTDDEYREGGPTECEPKTQLIRAVNGSGGFTVLILLEYPHAGCSRVPWRPPVSR